MLSSVLMAAVWGCRYAIPHMARGGGGSIINMSSGVARTPLGNHLAYGAAKGALEVLTAVHGRHVRARRCALQRDRARAS